MFSWKMRRVTPFVLALSLSLIPVAGAHAAGASRGKAPKLTASQSIPAWVGNLWQRMVSVWSKEGVTIDPNGGGGTGPGTSTPGTGTSNPTGSDPADPTVQG